MNKVEVLVATINQSDFSLADKMNLQTDAVIANQAGKLEYAELERNDRTIKMVTTNTKGAGINRNIALMYSSSDFLMLADDDVVYIDGYEKVIQSAFEELPLADVIVFRINATKDGEVIEDCPPVQKRLHIYNALKYGTYRIAIRRSSLLRTNLHFYDVFGPGCEYNMNEDSLFIAECLKKRLKIYAHKGYIGDTSKDSSTWFVGYDERFWYNKGAFIAAGFRSLRCPLIIYFLCRFKKLGDVKPSRRLKLILAGIQGYRLLQSYDEYVAEK